MNKKELLKPRYKVIAEDTSGNFHTGHILVNPDLFGEDYWLNENNGAIIHRPQNFPHLFKPLQWWEDRKLEEMPEFVKLINTRPSYGLREGHIRRVSFEKSGNGLSWIVDMFPVYVRVDDVTPATEQEYLNYIKSNQK